ncbi:hypothetical protein B0J13DRAFT_658617 [Dactylonectria estremocensis]|uniref:cyclin-dependent kinase n=1 Tax=Dactylonectria estremocensis TaxID=1079267 RepID=A0A9P9F3H7_9HYPO|nr:hypothetical protein B0J13DRAFT_658617 [Dactylonectria estremocensis]
MKQQPQPKPKPPRRPRYAAMRADQRADDQGERARTERGMKPSPRPASPREPRHASDSRARHRPLNQPEPSSHRHHHSRDRSRDRGRDRDRDRHPSSDPTRRAAETDDLIPRYRAGRDRNRDASDKPRRRSRSRSRSRDRGDRDSPSKRHRSRSASLTSSHRKRSRRDRSPRPRARDYSPESTSRKHGHYSSRDRRKSSPRRHARSPKSPSRIDEAQSRSARRSRSRSPSRADTGSRRTERESRSDKPRHQSRSRSAASERPNSLSHRPGPSSRGDYPETSSNSARDRAPDSERRSTQRPAPPRSPKAGRDRRHRDESLDRRHSAKSDIDEDMTSRGGPREGTKPSTLTSHTMVAIPRDTLSLLKPGVLIKPRHRNHHMERTVTDGVTNNTLPNSTYIISLSDAHTDRTRRQYSAQQSRSGNYGPSNGPSGSYHANATHSPPHTAPSGPMQQYPQGNYRGGYRGGGFRGGGFPGRGGHRAGFKNAHWSAGNQGPARGYHEDPNNGRFNSSNTQGDGDDDNPNAMDIDPTTNRSFKNLQVEGTDKEGESENGAMSPPSRQPPAGPGSQSQAGSSGKFSFAFKPSKPTPAAPKPEISQKFNAAPQRREPVKEDRDRHNEPPRSAPTEPASARSRHEFRNPPDGPRAVTVRMRKVKKVMKRLKPRPTLPADLVNSESVFFRKPGNESVVGSGTYGKVFKGLNVYTKGLVALKRIRMEGERDGFPVTAVREIKLLQSLRHINIVNLQEVMVEKNDCFMVFEYMSHDLTGLLNHPSFKLDAAQKKHLAKQLFEGLDYLHTRGVLHRDIKAANILVSNEGILKLADFGLARFYAKRHQLDYTNRVITIWYRSPELLLGETKYTAAVDVWSAACVMVEIFTRNAIFTGDGTELSQLEKIYNILGTPNRQEWPGLVDMAWFELLRPTAKRKNVFAEKYRERITEAGFDLLSAMFRYDPAKRPNAAEVLEHRYFTTEEPSPRQAIELANIDGDWHEFESKALRKENERRDREARKAAKEAMSRDKGMGKEKDKKRANEESDQERNSKRVHVGKDQTTKAASKEVTSTADKA